MFLRASLGTTVDLVSATPRISYTKLSNAELTTLTNYNKSLWETLGKATDIVCVYDMNFVRSEVKKTKPAESTHNSQKQIAGSLSRLVESVSKQ